MKISYITKYDKFFIYGLLIFLIPLFISILLVSNFVDFETPNNFPKSQQDTIYSQNIFIDTIPIKPLKKKKQIKIVKPDTLKKNVVLHNDSVYRN